MSANSQGYGSRLHHRLTLVKTYKALEADSHSAKYHSGVVPLVHSQGLGLLPITTAFLRTKQTYQIKGKVTADRGLLTEAQDISFEGYEIHMGRTKSDGGGVAFRIRERSGQPCDVFDGCLDASGRVLGTYVHGLFHNQALRRAILRHIARSKGRSLGFFGGDCQRDDEYDRLAELVRHSLNIDLLYAIAGLKRGK